MGLGFAPVKSEKEKPRTKRPKLTPINEIQTNLSSYFSDIRDPRVSRTLKHLLKDILVIAILAVIAGAQGWEDIENYGQSKQQWLEEFERVTSRNPSVMIHFVGCLRGSILKLLNKVSANGFNSLSLVSSEKLSR